ncbi:MAG: trypsin-like peptidase domain-containing protein [Clostridiales bacterium]|nr:trypsin-like peptidase domain-containing protein [Clostridiales bacterium]
MKKRAFARVAAVLTCAVMAGALSLSAGCVKKVTAEIVTYVSTDSRVYSTTAEVVAEVADSVVEISTETVTTSWGQQYVTSGAGSGVIMGKVSGGGAYYIITNNHVIEGANYITVKTRDGKGYVAELVATDDSADIAVVKISAGEELAIAVWGDSDDLQIGEDLIAIGNPLGSLGGTVTKGILSATGRMIEVGNYAMTLLQTDTAINPGNSGGGLFNMRGELIGVVNAKTTDEEIEGICFAIPANTAKSVYEDLIEFGYIKGRATFGIGVATGTVSSGGIGAQSQTVVYVTDAGNAADGTFMKYDRIYSVNGEKISSVLGLNKALANIAVGEKVKIEVYRGTATQSWGGTNISFASDLTEFTVTATQYGE